MAIAPMRSPAEYPAYDVMNRLVAVGTGYAQYSYAPSNKRVWRGIWTSSTLTTDEVTFWSISGQKLATYSMQLIGGLINSSSATAPQLVASQGDHELLLRREADQERGIVRWDMWARIGWDRSANIIPTARRNHPQPPTGQRSSPAMFGIQKRVWITR